ncbi:MAG: HlyD family efflux transporter periplasmic adaptor subunit [Magnetococcales bacterium]|nr:HlyD family efflux transporter periplasmic adaptor subunit [Magnetococcales bacterium]NGZ27177.1 HlyD family efflux transporter periplasmic adaptor subunit [Magnetococcales bacterium]
MTTPVNPALQGKITALEGQVTALTAFFQLERAARRAENLDQLAFVMVNDSHRLFHYRQALLVQWQYGNRPIWLAASGVDQVDGQAPFLQWLSKVVRHGLNRQNRIQFQHILQTSLPEALLAEGTQWAAGDVAWCPLEAKGSLGLVLIREEAWSEGEQQLLGHMAEVYGHAWRALQPRRLGVSLLEGASWRRWLIPAAVAVAMMIPVRLSELAPAQVVARNPWLVTAPLDGVIQKIHVQPNQLVKEGELLFTLEDTALRNRLEVARKVLAVASAQFQSTRQKAFADERSKGELLMLRAKVEEKQAEVVYTEELLQQSQVVAPKEGVALFEGVDDWQGKPVKVGERVMTLAHPKDAEMEILLPANKGFIPEENAQVSLFLNTDPTHPLAGSIRLMGYEPFPAADNVLSYRLRASLTEQESLPRLGLMGTARIQGNWVPLIYYLLRRPYTSLRQGIGL